MAKKATPWFWEAHSGWYVTMLLKAIPDQRFRDLLIASYDSGGRPFEVKELEARHCQFDKQRAVIPKDEAKGRKPPHHLLSHRPQPGNR
jgi:hypothetical protein